MTKWEYLRLPIHSDGEKILAIYVNEENIANDDKNIKTLSSYLNEVGRDGWELVSATKDQGLWIYLFKRLIEE
jgi:hypothetical protein